VVFTTIPEEQSAAPVSLARERSVSFVRCGATLQGMADALGVEPDEVPQAMQTLTGVRPVLPPYKDCEPPCVGPDGARVDYEISEVGLD
jgi:hypothetical protein